MLIHRNENNEIISSVKIERGGTKFWYFEGDLHREDGPAIIWPDGNKRWYLDGIRFYEESKWLNKVLFNEVKIELYEP
jgi:hypothetical protein